MVGFSGGQKLLEAIKQIGAKLKGAHELRVGFLENSSYPDGTPTAMVAAIQEFGAPAAGIPPRPFMRPTVAKGEKLWPAQLAKIIKAADYDAALSLQRMGMNIKAQVQQSISEVWSPPLAEATVQRKGFDKPLVDTGHMQNSVDYEIK